MGTHSLLSKTSNRVKGDQLPTLRISIVMPRAPPTFAPIAPVHRLQTVAGPHKDIPHRIGTPSELTARIGPEGITGYRPQ